jgi:hypothetical protein
MFWKGCPANGVTPLRVISLNELRGTSFINPVVGLGFPRKRKTFGLKNVRVKGEDIECVVTPVCVPPSAVTATCFPVISGAESVTCV